MVSAAELYAISIDEFCDEALFSRVPAGVPRERRERAARFRRSDDRKRCILADALVRRVAAEKTGARPDSIRYAYNAHGKPYIDNAPWLRFNVSHSGRWVLAGFSEREIGVDVERIGDVAAPLARYALHPEEQRAYAASGDAGLFFRFWTLKESYIKYLGLGLSVPLDSFYFVLTQNSISLRFDGARNPPERLAPADCAGKTPFFGCFNPDGGHAAAVCSEAPAACAARRVRPAELYDGLTPATIPGVI